jgi:hypothetical protein
MRNRTSCDRKPRNRSTAPATPLAAILRETTMRAPSSSLRRCACTKNSAYARAPPGAAHTCANLRNCIFCGFSPWFASASGSGHGSLLSPTILECGAIRPRSGFFLAVQFTGGRPILASSCLKAGSPCRLAKPWSTQRFSRCSSCDWMQIVRYLSASRVLPSRASVCATK